MGEQLLFPLELSSTLKKKIVAPYKLNPMAGSSFKEEPAIGEKSVNVIREWEDSRGYRFAEVENSDGNRVVYLDPRSMLPWLYDADGNRIKDVERRLHKQYIYLIRQGETDYYKIGLSIDIKQRLKTFNMGSGIRMSLVCLWKIENAAKSEKRIHKQFKEYNEHGEWFIMNKDALEKLFTYMQSIKAAMV